MELHGDESNLVHKEMLAISKQEKSSQSHVHIS